AESFEIAAIWALLAALVLLALWGVVWLVRAARRKRAASRLTEAIIPSVDAAGQGPATRNDAAVLRKAMLEAINTIKTSKLGLTRGAAALYELPWYMIIGNPAAGKSSAIKHSGLNFPIPG